MQKVEFSPDGATLLSVRALRQVRLWDLAELSLGQKHFLGAAFTRDGRHLATVSHEEPVKFWDTSSWRVTQEYAWEVGGLRCIAFDPDGFRAAAAGTGKKIVVWDLDE